MIRGAFVGHPGRKRPVIVARVGLVGAGRLQDVRFVIDTGADRTLLSTGDADTLGLDVLALPTGRSRGIGGMAVTALADVELVLGEQRLVVAVRILVPSGPSEQEGLRRTPSVIGRDVLSHFGLYLEERRDLVLLFEPAETQGLNLA